MSLTRCRLASATSGPSARPSATTSSRRSNPCIATIEDCPGRGLRRCDRRRVSPLRGADIPKAPRAAATKGASGTHGDSRTGGRPGHRSLVRRPDRVRHALVAGARPGIAVSVPLLRCSRWHRPARRGVRARSIRRRAISKASTPATTFEPNGSSTAVQEWVLDPTKMRALGILRWRGSRQVHGRAIQSSWTACRSRSTAARPAMSASKAVRQLRRGELRAIFTVDIFNEGVDIPEIDTILLPPAHRERDGIPAAARAEVCGGPRARPC